MRLDVLGPLYAEAEQNDIISGKLDMDFKRRIALKSSSIKENTLLYDDEEMSLEQYTLIY
jgi:hypothetical protein